MEPELTAPLRIFVYGSLKRGYRNHTAYCQGYESFRTATVVGRLYRQADGYPMLVVPPESILAQGTSDFGSDMQQLAQLDASTHRQDLPATETRAANLAARQWQEISGEIYDWPAGYPQASDILSRLDQLEDFYPDGKSAGGKASLYDRVMLLAQHDEGVEPVWTFVAPAGLLPAGIAPMGRSWP